MADPRAFGYIFGSPDQGHRFFGIKTDKHANLVRTLLLVLNGQSVYLLFFPFFRLLWL